MKSDRKTLGIDFTSYVDQAIKTELSKLDSYYLQKTRSGFLLQSRKRK